jgi:hypothetical protein
MQSVRIAAAAAAVVLVGSASAPAFAAPSPTATGAATPLTAATTLPTPVPSPVAPSTVCTISKSAAVQITGLVATADGYVVIDGKNNSWGNRVAYLDKKCGRVGSAQSYPNGAAVDPQDIAVDSKGTLWIADTGDQPVTPERQTIALFKVTSKDAMTRYRFSYPDGQHNTEALLLNGNGAPIFITKEISGAATIFTYTGALATGKTMKLTKVGQFTPEQTGTANKLGNRGPAQNEITGGATSPDGKKVALRTLTDAYEWDVTNGDVIGALTKGKPRITPMPNEEQGYAIAYTSDGKSFLTVSDVSSSTPILEYKPSVPLSAAAAKKAAAAAAGPHKPGALHAWFNKLTFSQLMWLLAGVAAIGFVLLLIGVVGIRRARKGFATEAARGGQSGADPDSDPRVPSAAGGSGVYGAPRSVPPSGSSSGAGYRPDDRSSDPYAAPSSPPGPPAGGVYGGGQYPGGQYSGGQYSGGQYSGSGGQHPGGPGPGGAPGHGAPGDRGPNGPRSGGAGSDGPNGGRGGAQPSGGQYGGGQYGGGQYGAPADPYGDEGPDYPGARRGTPYGDGQYRG